VVTVSVVLCALAVALVVIVVQRDGRPAGDEAAAELVAAWERSRAAEFVARGTWQRRSEVTGTELTSEAYLAQRPPQRVQRELGGVQGRVEDRLLLCPTEPAGDAVRCALGAPTGVSYDDAVAAEAAAFAATVLGDDALYAVRHDDGCFELDQQRADPLAPYGEHAVFCFDDATGAPVRREVRFSGGVVETVVYDDVSGEVTDADLRP
jgi:hypothetical protein